MLTKLRRTSAVAPTCCPVPHELREHHDRLLRVDTDPEELLDLLELAVTWAELDYSGVPVLGPERWERFADDHRWQLPERAERAFSLAVDLAALACRSARQAEDAPRANLRAVVADVVAI